MSIVNAYMIAPHEIEPDNVMLFVIKAIVMHDGTYRVYRCLYNGPTDEDHLPQGSRVGIEYEREVAEAIFPTLASVAEPDCL